MFVLVVLSSRHPFLPFLLQLLMTGFISLTTLHPILFFTISLSKTFRALLDRVTDFQLDDPHTVLLNTDPIEF